MANQIALKVTLDDKGAVQGVEKITKSVEGLKRADAGLDWKGTEAGGKAARESNEGYTVLKGTLANLASTAVTAAVGGIRDAASAVVEIGSAFRVVHVQGVGAVGRHRRRPGRPGVEGPRAGQQHHVLRVPGRPTPWDTWRSPGWDTQAMLAGVGPVLSLARRASSTWPPPPTS